MYKKNNIAKAMMDKEKPGVESRFYKVLFFALNNLKFS